MHSLYIVVYGFYCVLYDLYIVMYSLCIVAYGLSIAMYSLYIVVYGLSIVKFRLCIVVYGRSIVGYGPGDPRLEVPQVQVAVHVPEHHRLALPCDARDAAHTALQAKQSHQCSVCQNNAVSTPTLKTQLSICRTQNTCSGQNAVPK